MLKQVTFLSVVSNSKNRTATFFFKKKFIFSHCHYDFIHHTLQLTDTINELSLLHLLNAFFCAHLQVIHVVFSLFNFFNYTLSDNCCSNTQSKFKIQILKYLHIINSKDEFFSVHPHFSLKMVCWYETVL